MKAKRTLIALFATGTAVAMLVMLMPNVAAQAASFGTQVKYGDNDFIPQLSSIGTRTNLGLTSTFNHRLNVTRVDFGTQGDVNDDCYYLRMGNDTAAQNSGQGQTATVRTYDVRIVVSSGCAGKTVGSFVTDSDTAEKGQTGASMLVTGGPAGAHASQQISPRLVHADVNNNNRYDMGDCVYITGGPRTSLAPAANQAVTMNTTSNTAFTIRMTPCSGKAAGTLVFSGDADQVAYGGAGGLRLLAGGSIAASLAGVGLFDADNNGNVSAGDRIYLNTTSSAASTTTALAPLYAVRVVGASAADFGTQVKYGEADFKPAIGAATVDLDLTHDVRVARIDFGTSGDVTDDCFYLRGNTASATTISTFDIRVVVGSGCAGKTLGSFVSDTDTTEKGQANATTVANGFRVRYADVNNNGRYDSGDCVYLSTSAVAAALDVSSNTLATIRMTPCSGKAAGTLLFSGDADQVAYGAAGSTIQLATYAQGVYDADLSGTISVGDRVYLNGTVGAARLVPLFATRITGDAGQFGTQVKFGESDFIPTIDTTPDLDLTHDVRVARIDFGTAGDVTDDCFYLRTNTASATTISTYDIRIAVASGCSGKTIGSLVMDTDTTEKGQANATTVANGFRVRYADVNNNGRYDSGDCVFLSTSAVAAALDSSSNTLATIRMTPCSGKAAGTLLFSGDADQVAYGAAGSTIQLTTHAYGAYDADASGTFSPGDRAYLNATTTNGLAPLFSVRLVGDFTTGGGGGTATSSGTSAPTSAGTSGTPTTTTSRQTTGTTGTSGTTPPTTPTKKTPGLELVAVIAGVAVVVAVVSRLKK